MQGRETIIGKQSRAKQIRSKRGLKDRMDRMGWAGLGWDEMGWIGLG